MNYFTQLTSIFLFCSLSFCAIILHRETNKAGRVQAPPDGWNRAKNGWACTHPRQPQQNSIKMKQELEFYTVVNKAIDYLNQTRKEKGNNPLSVTEVYTPEAYKNWVWKAPKGEVLEVARVITDLLFSV